MHSVNIKESKKFKGLYVIESSHFKDHRGTIYTTIDDSLRKKILPKNFLFNHVKIATRKKKVLAGIHGDRKSFKLITCVKGKIIQYSVNNIAGDKNYLKYEKLVLSEKNKKMVLIPPNYGNLFICEEDSTIIYHYAYKGKYLDVNDQFTIKFYDPRIKLKLKIDNLIISDRDK